MAKEDELKKSIKELVKEIVSDTVAKLVKVSAKKTVIGLRDRLKEEAVHRVEEKLKKTAKELKKDFSGDVAKDSEYVSKLKEAFEEKFQKLLTSLSRGLLKPLIIASAGALVVGGALGGLVVYNTTDPTLPPPQPDLVITEITFEIEVVKEEVFDMGPLVPTVEIITSYEITVHYTIENQGDEDAGESITHLSLIGETASYTIAPLSRGEPRKETAPVISFSEEELLLYLFLFQTARLEIYADYGDRIDESNEENNCITLESNIPY